MHKPTRALLDFPVDPQLTADQVRGVIMFAQGTADDQLKQFGLKTVGKTQIESWSGNEVGLSWEVESL